MLCAVDFCVEDACRHDHGAGIGSRLFLHDDSDQYRSLGLTAIGLPRLPVSPPNADATQLGVGEIVMPTLELLLQASQAVLRRERLCLF